MPDSYFQLSRQNQASALAAGSDFSGRAPHLLEKDIWVVWALATLFRSDLGAHLVFKARTSGAARQLVFPCWSAAITIVPAPFTANTLPVRLPGPETTVNVTGFPDMPPVATSVTGHWRSPEPSNRRTSARLSA